MWKSAKDSSTPVGVIRGKYWLLLAVLPRGIAIKYLHEILAYLPRIAGSDFDVFHAREFSKILDFGEPSVWKILRVICQTGE